jgi:plasmid rolling circle replication initiator protein Rep
MKLDYLKALSLEACESLAQIPSEITHTGRQLRCADFLHYAIDADTFAMALNRANFCKQRSCAVCSWLRSAKLRIKIFRGLPRLLDDYQGFHFLLLTLTVKNTHFSQLRATIRLMESGWGRLVKLVDFPAIGSLKTLEVTRPRDCYYAGQFVGRMGAKAITHWISELKRRGMNTSFWVEHFCEEVHPHFHALLLVGSDYFEAANYLHHSEWVTLWQRAMRLDYRPVVDIRKVHRVDNAIFEVSKYCVKSFEMSDLLGCFITRQLHNLRLLSINGAFTDYFSQAAMDAIAATAELGDETWQEGVPCWYEWNGEKYSLTRLAHLEWELD